MSFTVSGVWPEAWLLKGEILGEGGRIIATRATRA